MIDDIPKKPRKEQKKVMLPSMFWKERLITTYLEGVSYMAIVSTAEKYDRGKLDAEYEQAHGSFQICVLSLWAMLREKLKKKLSEEEKALFQRLDDHIIKQPLSRGRAGTSYSISIPEPRSMMISVPVLYRCFLVLQKFIDTLGLTRLERPDYELGSTMA